MPGYDQAVPYDADIPYDSAIGYAGDTREIRTTAWDPAYGSEVAALARAKGRGWVHELADVGSASFNLQRSDPDVASLEDGSIVRFTIGGETRFAARVGPWSQETLAEGEEPAWVRTWSLKGLRSILGEALVYPEIGLAAVVPDPDHRLFNWTSGHYDDSEWDTAYVVKALWAWAEDPYPSAPRDWPSALLGAKWIWAQAPEEV